MDADGAVTEDVVMRTTVRARLRLNNTTKHSLWHLRQQQREFYNLGVETALFFHKVGEPIPSDYTAHTSVFSAFRKDKTNRWSRQNLSLQRAGLAAGIAAVRKWSKHKRNLENNLDYWTGRAEKDPDDPKVAQKRELNRSLQRVGIRAALDAICRSCQKDGTDLLGVPPYYTSQTCSLCGEIGKREEQVFTCTSRGVVIHAGFNVARNLRKVAYLALQAAARLVVERRSATTPTGDASRTSV